LIVIRESIPYYRIFIPHNVVLTCFIAFVKRSADSYSLQSFSTDDVEECC